MTIALDTVDPLQHSVGYGALGVGGSLGYEGKAVSVGGTHYRHALSTHAPARLLYHIGGRASTFRCDVALNDDVGSRSASADFAVFADGREVASGRGVSAGEPARPLECDISGASLLELVVATSDWNFCHAVWLEPEIDDGPPPAQRERLVDPLARAEIERPPPIAPVRRCLATVASPGWDQLLDDMLGSVIANGDCPDALLVVFLVGSSPECEAVVAKYRALPVRCRPLVPTDMGTKSVLYSVASVVDADAYVCLDADMLVLDRLEPLFGAIEAAPDGSVLACREGNGRTYADVADAITRVYGGTPHDLTDIVGGDSGELGSYPLAVNDGTFAGSRAALLALEATIRSLPGAVRWIDSRNGVRWRNQLIFNLAVAIRQCGIELDQRWNLQLNSADVEIETVAGRPRVMWNGKRVHVLHSNGWGRSKCPQLRGLYARVADPVVGRGEGDTYEAFLRALRAWLGRYGLSGLTPSLYDGSPDRVARIDDPSVLPVLALVHYLIRANGCVSVVETGTGRGISAACLASAVSHRQRARVVTFDALEFAGRSELWGALPAAMCRCIEQRQVDPIAGLSQAVDDGERYDAALLDLARSEEHPSEQLDLARNLVRPGGPILIGASHATGEVTRLLRATRRARQGVVRLLTDPDQGGHAAAGLALVENRSGA